MYFKRLARRRDVGGAPEGSSYEQSYVARPDSTDSAMQQQQHYMYRKDWPLPAEDLLPPQRSSSGSSGAVMPARTSASLATKTSQGRLSSFFSRSQSWNFSVPQRSKWSKRTSYSASEQRPLSTAMYRAAPATSATSQSSQSNQSIRASTIPATQTYSTVPSTRSSFASTRSGSTFDRRASLSTTQTSIFGSGSSGASFAFASGGGKYDSTSSLVVNGRLHPAYRSSQSLMPSQTSSQRNSNTPAAGQRSSTRSMHSDPVALDKLAKTVWHGQVVSVPVQRRGYRQIYGYISLSEISLNSRNWPSDYENVKFTWEEYEGTISLTKGRMVKFTLDVSTIGDKVLSVKKILPLPVPHVPAGSKMAKSKSPAHPGHLVKDTHGEFDRTHVF